MTDKNIAAMIDDAHEATVLNCDPKTLLAISSAPFPPGRPLQLVLQLEDGELALEGRCIGSKKRDDGKFDLRVQLMNLRRETRASIERVFAARS